MATNDTQQTVVWLVSTRKQVPVPYASFGILQSTTQTASRAVQPLFAGILWQTPTDRPTDHATRSVTT